MRIRDYVRRDVDSPMSGRAGTAYAHLSTLIAAIGEPSWVCPPEETDPSGGVTMRWYFNTPKGLAEIRNYWSNQPGEWSICSKGKVSTQYLCRYLRSLGVPAWRRMYLEEVLSLDAKVKRNRKCLNK